MDQISNRINNKIRFDTGSLQLFFPKFSGFYKNSLNA